MFKNTKNNFACQKGKIDPGRNFLLSRATLLGERCEETGKHTLYRLHNGNYAVLIKTNHPFSPDQLKSISHCEAKQQFKFP